MSTRSPVLFLVFNRPDTTQRVFDAIRAAQPPRLYVAADGPRAGDPAEAERCAAVRRIATAVDWPCELVTLIRPENLGCKRAVSSAITWFFEYEPEGIILEDDCLPDPSFFGYCDALLEHYRDDDRIMCISGDNFISAHCRTRPQLLFFSLCHIWGWASWARAWEHYSVDLNAKSGERIEAVPPAPFQQRRVCETTGTGCYWTWRRAVLTPGTTSGRTPWAARGAELHAALQPNFQCGVWPRRNAYDERREQAGRNAGCRIAVTLGASIRGPSIRKG